VTVAQRHHARSEQAGTLLGVVCFSCAVARGGLPVSLSHQRQDLDRGVIVVHHLALRRLPDELRKGRSDVPCHRLDDVPLG